MSEKLPMYDGPIDRKLVAEDVDPQFLEKSKEGLLDALQNFSEQDYQDEKVDEQDEEVRP